MDQSNELPELLRSDFEFFKQYRKDLFYVGATYESSLGTKVPILYADATAMGSPMRRIEDAVRELLNQNDPLDILKKYEGTLIALDTYTNAQGKYSFIPIGTGCTGAMNLLFRDILALRIPDYVMSYGVVDRIPEKKRPIFITTLMEHHSSDLVLRECFGKEIIHIGFDEKGLPDMGEMETHLRRLVSQGESEIYLVCSGGSNVTGLQPDLDRIVALAQTYKVFLAFDFAAAGPYTKIDLTRYPVDAIGLSPHKFPGGPQTAGLLIIRNDVLRENNWTQFPVTISSQIELIRTGFVFELKSQMNVNRIQRVVSFYSEYALKKLSKNPLIEILGHNDISRFAIISFIVKSHFSEQQAPASQYHTFLLKHTTAADQTVYYVHHNFVARLLSDIFGAQVRPGCSCAGAYGHWLLQIDPELSLAHRQRIDSGLLDQKPGWVRITFNELNTLSDVNLILEAIEHITEHWMDYAEDYEQNQYSGEFLRKNSSLPDIRLTEWSMLRDPGKACCFSPAIDSFIREKILPQAANTHTETSFTGTISTMWYHWAYHTILHGIGADEQFALKFIRAGYCCHELLVYYLGGSIHPELERKYHISEAIPELLRPAFLYLGADAQHVRTHTFGALFMTDSLSKLIHKAQEFVLAPKHAVIKPSIHSFDELLQLINEIRPVVSTLILDITDLIGNYPIKINDLDVDGAIIYSDKLPGGWHTHPVLVLRKSLFHNRIPYDVGGGVVHWTTQATQRYVKDRTALEDAGTPGIIQGIRTGMVIGRLLYDNSGTDQ